MPKAKGLPHRTGRLTALSVKSLGPGFHGDGAGLHLKVDATGSRRWVQRLVVRGKRTDIGIGPASTVSLAEARRQAQENRTIARAGGDPLAERQQAKAIPTFEEAARTVHELFGPTWRNPKHRDQWISTLERYAFPHFGRTKVSEVSSGDVMRALSPIWVGKPETARRTRQRIRKVFSWVIAQGWRKDNPAAELQDALPKSDRRQVHHKALPYQEVPAAIATVKSSHAMAATKLAMEFLVLTAGRSGEIRGATWSEIDIEARTWTIPAARMKAKKDHRVPLSDRAIEILEEAKLLRDEDSDLVFPGGKRGAALSDMTIGKLLRENGIPCVAHGFRSSFRDWAEEATSFPHAVKEAALAHTIPNRTERAYRRTDLFEQRRKMMDAWSVFVSGGAAVVQLHEVANG